MSLPEYEQLLNVFMTNSKRTILKEALDKVSTLIYSKNMDFIEFLSKMTDELPNITIIFRCALGIIEIKTKKLYLFYFFLISFSSAQSESSQNLSSNEPPVSSNSSSQKAIHSDSEQKKHNGLIMQAAIKALGFLCHIEAVKLIEPEEIVKLVHTLDLIIQKSNDKTTVTNCCWLFHVQNLPQNVLYPQLAFNIAQVIKEKRFKNSSSFLTECFYIFFML